MSIAVSAQEMTAWAGYIHDICGVNLDESKTYLLETRLSGLLKETGAGSFGELLVKVKNDFSNSFRRKVIDGITTNETSFFRDTMPFELLRYKLLPECVDRKTRSGRKPVQIRIWSAACSTGQEVFSTAIVIRELLGDLRDYDVRILGTDISDRAVTLASYGVFSRFDLERGLTGDRINRYFSPHSGGSLKIRDEIRVLATFRHMNLLEPFSFPQPFDIIFCRNVAIYFTQNDKIRLFRNIARCLAPDGCLLIGATESITGLCPEFEPKRHLRSIFYQLKG
jgi:chemotaxis protein methyltransferase CheR